MVVCALCGTAVYSTPSGYVCPEHGGGPPVEERRDDPAQLDAAGARGHIAQLRAHVEAGGTLDRANALWLLERAEGGGWGRMAARAQQDAREHRKQLRRVCNALVDGSSNGWTAEDWKPIADLLEERPSDGRPAQVPDWPFRMVEMGEGRE